jgi:23S rRNA (adenine2030-N6)-methyltransferase
VVLIDPPYEEKQDYNRVVEMLQESLQRFATGTYIIWYPLLQRAEPAQMIEKLKALELEDSDRWVWYVWQWFVYCKSALDTS